MYIIDNGSYGIREEVLRKILSKKKRESIGMWILFAFVSTNQIKIQYLEIESD